MERTRESMSQRSILFINAIFLKPRTNLNVPFLNLLATLQERSGQVNVRVGGNTQENATLVDSLPNGKALLKTEASIVGPVSVITLVMNHFSHRKYFGRMKAQLSLYQTTSCTRCPTYHRSFLPNGTSVSTQNRFEESKCQYHALGVPFNDTTSPRLQIVDVGESILGDNLLGFQVGNEPDFYAS